MVEKKGKDTQARKFQITINNPKEKGLDAAKIGELLNTLTGLVYYCLSEEIGGETQQHHIHVFVIYKNPKLFSTMKNKFPQAHFEMVKGSNSQNRDYVFKEGRWEGTEKGLTKIEGTQIESGDLPPDRSNENPELRRLFELIESGRSTYDILDEFPEYMMKTIDIDRCRRIIKETEMKNIWRTLSVTYIFGKTGTGKTRHVMEKYGYETVFRVTDYHHPFDTYEGQDVIVFEEFNSSITIQDMLNYLDGYPVKLPARYTDKVASFTKVYITSNLQLTMQYPNVQEEKPEVWEALLRRITDVVEFESGGKVTKYGTADEYMEKMSSFMNVKPNEENPFSCAP